MSTHRLLIVDDEPSVLALLRRYLERLGYSVETAATAGEGLRLFETCGGSYDLVIADLQLPDLNGEEMIRRMRLQRHQMVALFSSGYPAVNSESSSDRQFIQKPFLPEKLAERIEEILSLR